MLNLSAVSIPAEFEVKLPRIGGVEGLKPNSIIADITKSYIQYGLN